MAPMWLGSLSPPSEMKLFSRHVAVTSVDPDPVWSSVAAQWQNPADILAILMLLGPTVVQRAIAQLAGRTITPVAFSFGWVAYAASALLASFGDGCLMPESEAMLTTINANSGHGRITRNWVMGRLLRDFNNTLDKEMKHELSHIPSDSHGHLSADREGSRVRQESKHFEGLRVTVFEVDNTPPAAHGVPTPDWVWYSGFAVIICQLLIASLPWGMSGQWDTFLVTAAGVFLALVSGSLPQWRREKWACPHKGSDTTIITEGNGSRSAIVILGKKGVGLHLEVLARGTRTAQPTLLTSVATSILAVLWILILLTVAGMKQNAWYLLGIGLLGSIQNLVAAAAPRSPAALGFHIKLVETIQSRRVKDVLRQVEEKYPLVGTALLDVFFPGSLRIAKEETDERRFWLAALDARYKENKNGIRLDCRAPVAHITTKP